MKQTLISIALTLLVSANSFAELHPARALSKSENPVLVTNETSRANTIVLSYTIPQPTFEATTTQSVRGYATIRASVSSCAYLAKPGEPEIPTIPVRVILPYGKGVATVEVIAEGEETTTLAAPLSYGEREVPISQIERSVTPRSEKIYNAEEVYPTALYEEHKTQKAFGVSIAKFSLYPMSYVPKSGQVKYYKNMQLRITLKDVAPSGDIRIDVERFKERGHFSEENEKALDTYPSVRARAEVDYVLVTTDAIAAGSAVSDLIGLRQEQGFSTKVVTVREIESEYNGAASSDKLRNFIKHAYNSWGTKFVTLGGDAGVVPHIVSKVKSGYNFKDVDSDIPFQCLDGDSWDGDYEAEVYVGRISAENETEFANQAHKIITYESEDDKSPVLRTSLANGQNLDWNNMGARSIRYLLATVFPETWEYDSLYDEQFDWVQADLVAALAKNKYGSLDHDGHGSVGGTMNFDVGETGAMTNTKYPFIYTLSCLTGDFSEDCIAEHFMNEHKVGGFFGGVQNSEVGLYMQSNSTQGSSPTIHRSFYEAFWQKGMEYFSQMNAYSHQMNTDRQFTCFTTNYFGDAATRFRARDHEGAAVIGQKVSVAKSGAPALTAISAKTQTLSFRIEESTTLAIALYTLSGKRVFVSPAMTYQEGRHNLSFGGAIANGLYLVEFSGRGKTVRHKISL